MQMEDSDAEDEEDGGMDREKIANQLFDDDVSTILSHGKRNLESIFTVGVSYMSWMNLCLTILFQNPIIKSNFSSLSNFIRPNNSNLHAYHIRTS